MWLLIPDTKYWEAGEVTEDFGETILNHAQAEFGPLVHVQEVDAGPSASIPAVVLQIISAAADAIALFAGPVVITESIKWWKKQFDAVKSHLTSKGLEFSVDSETAALLAADAIVPQLEAAADLEVISVTRHWFNLNGAWSDHFSFDPAQTSAWITDPHGEAVKQFNVRYIFLLRSGSKGFTAVVEKDGHVSIVDPL